MRIPLLILWAWMALAFGVVSAHADAPIHAAAPIHAEMAALAARPFLDDYDSNVLKGYRIVTETGLHAGRYSGNPLRCGSCHLEAGTRPDAIPLNVAGLYPKWRSKNHQRNGIGLRIRECFVYSLNGIKPPENAPEVLAVSAYIHHLSMGQVIGQEPPGRGTPTLSAPVNDPNPARGAAVYDGKCASCHGKNGAGTPAAAPPLWGMESYNQGAGMHRIDVAAGFIWANMPVGQERSLSLQEAWDVAAFLHGRPRPADPRSGLLPKLAERLLLSLTRMNAHVANLLE